MLPETSQLRIRLHAWQKVIDNCRDGVIAAKTFIQRFLTHCVISISFWLRMGNHWLTSQFITASLFDKPLSSLQFTVAA